MVQYVFANAPASAATLDSGGSGITSGATTIVLTSGDGAKLPSPGAGQAAILRIDDEYLTYTTRSTDTLTGVTRGVDGSTAAAHSAGATVRNVASKGFFDNVLQAGQGGNVTSGTVYGSEPGSPTAGDLNLYSDIPFLARRATSTWPQWGPAYPLTAHDDSGFAWVNQTSGSVSGSVDTTKGGVYLLAPSVAGWNARLRVKTVPTRPYTITVGILPNVFHGNFSKIGLCWRESSSGKVVTFAYGFNSGTNAGPVYEVNYLTNPTTFSSTALSTSGSDFGSLLWLRIVEDTTNRECWVSNDKVHWRRLHQVSRTTHLTGGADQIGYFANNEGAGDAGMWIVSWEEA